MYLWVTERARRSTTNRCQHHRLVVVGAWKGNGRLPLIKAAHLEEVAGRRQCNSHHCCFQDVQPDV